MKLLVAVAGLGLLATATVAQEDDIWKFTINNATNAKWTVNPDKLKPKKVAAPEIPGELALRVKATKGANPWDQQANSPAGGAIKQGDVVMIIYYARAAEPAAGGTILPTFIQMPSAPYTSILDVKFTVTDKWDQYCAHAVSSIDLPKANVSIHLASADQVLEFGPVFVFNFGQNYDRSRLKGCQALG